MSGVFRSPRYHVTNSSQQLSAVWRQFFMPTNFVKCYCSGQNRMVSLHQYYLSIWSREDTSTFAWLFQLCAGKYEDIKKYWIESNFTCIAIDDGIVRFVTLSNPNGRILKLACTCSIDTPLLCFTMSFILGLTYSVKVPDHLKYY